MNNIITLFLLSYVLLFSTYASAQQQITISQVQLYNLGVKLGHLEPVQQIPLLYAPATVVIPPDQEYIVSAAQAGLVSRLYVAIGDSVKKGQRLADINSPELLTLQRQFLKAHNNRNLIWANYQRDKKLYNEGVIADRRWQQSRSQYNSTNADVNEARQLLEIAGLTKSEIKNLATTRRLSSVLTIRAPIAGVILERSVIAGERVDIMAPLYRLANLQQLWLEIKIPQQHMKNIKLGDQVLINDYQAIAHISLLGQHVNPKTQTVLTRAVIEQNHQDVRAGQSVNTQIIQTSQQAVFKIPNNALAQHQGQHYLFLRNEGGFAVQAVKILAKEETFSMISGEFTEQQQIAIRGAVALKAKWIGLGEEGES